MTVGIAIKNGNSIVLAADSLVTDGSTNSYTDKIQLYGTTHIISAGHSLVYDVIEEMHSETSLTFYTRQDIVQFVRNLNLNLKARLEEVGSEDDIHSQKYIIISHGTIYEATGLGEVIMQPKYSCIGAGAEVAFGVIYLSESIEIPLKAVARIAINAAISRCTYCGGDVSIVSFEV